MGYLNQRIPIFYVLILIMTCIVITALILNLFAFDTDYPTREVFKKDLTGTSILIADQLPGDIIDAFKPGDENTSEYIHLTDQIAELKKENSAIQSIQIWKVSNTTFTSLVDDPENQVLIGRDYTGDPGSLFQIKRACSGQIFEIGSSSGDQEYILTGYIPILTSQGKPAAVMVIRINFASVLEYLDEQSEQKTANRSFILLIVALFIVVASPILIYIIYKPRRLFNELFQHSIDTIVIIQNRRIREVNAAALHLEDRFVSQLHGSDPFTFIYPQDRVRAMAKLKRIESGQSKFEEIELKSNLSGDSAQWLDIRAFPIQWYFRPAVLCLVRDVTESKNVISALKESEERYSAIVNNAPEPVIIHKNGIILFANEAAVQVLGYTHKEINGTNILSYMPTDSQVQAFERICATNKHRQFQEYETNFIRKDGSILTLLVKGARILYQNKSVVLVHLVDITERKHIEQALSKANQQLNLMTNITRHDILNGITAILGYLEIARADHNFVTSARFLDLLTIITMKIREQIEFTGDYQNIGLEKPSWQNFASILTRLHPPDDIEFTCTCSSYEIFVDLLFEKVFQNLVDNSIRHGEKVTRITLSCMEDSKELVILYVDDGTGIPDSEKEVVFSSGWGKNTGYGLFLIREILSITGISIKETGIFGEGVRFEIRVPKGSFRKTGDTNPD